MGYELNKFVDIQEISANHRCLLCNLVLQDPLQTTCEHNFCNQCITIYLQSTNHCPHFDEDSVSVKSDKKDKKSPLRKISSFRKIIGKSPKDKFPILKLSDLKQLPESTINELNSLKVFCENNLNGCQEQQLTLSNLSEHLKVCKYTEPKASGQSSGEEQSAADLTESNEMKNKSTVTRKDSDNKSNGEIKSTMASEEEVGSDDFVVIPQNVGTESAKSTESVQSSLNPASSESKENLNNQPDDTANAEKKKKKKKKKKATKTDGDTVSLDAASLKGSSGADSQTASQSQSKESLAEQEDMKRTLKDFETKNENLRLINSQLLGQIKQLKEEKDEFTKKLQVQLDTSGEVDELKIKLQQLEKDNKSQALRIIQLLDSNENMNKFIMTLRDEQAQLKKRYNDTLDDILKMRTNIAKSCKLEVN